MKQGPFSIYDFLGYFTPGATALYLTNLVIKAKAKHPLPFMSFFEVTPSINIEGIAIFVISSYIIGHFISFLSAMTIETYANWIYGYPAKFILGHKSESSSENDKSDILLKIIISIILLPFIIIDLPMYIIMNKSEFKKLSNFTYFIRHGSKQTDPDKTRQLYYKRLDKTLINVINIKVTNLFNHLGISDQFESKKFGFNSDFNRIVRHYIYEHSKESKNNLFYYLSLFGFLRSVSFIFISFLWYLLWCFISNSYFERSNVAILMLISYIITFTFFMAFMKFYRKYALEGLMALVINKDIRENLYPNLPNENINKKPTSPASTIQ